MSTMFVDGQRVAPPQPRPAVPRASAILPLVAAIATLPLTSTVGSAAPASGLFEFMPTRRYWPDFTDTVGNARMSVLGPPSGSGLPKSRAALPYLNGLAWVGKVYDGLVKSS